MGTILVQTTIDRVRLDLLDPDEVTWTDEDLVGDYNEGLLALVGSKIDAYPITAAQQLDAGTVQTIPEDGQVIIDVLENEGGKGITSVDRRLLDARNRNWPTMTPTAAVAHWMADPRNPKQWRSYPPNTGQGIAVIVYGGIPEPVALAATDGNDVLPLDDSYEPAIYAYIMGAAYRRNTTRQDLVKADGYFQRFLTLLGLTAKSETAIAPRTGVNPGVK